MIKREPILTGWIKGEKVKKFDNNNILQEVNFILDINTVKYEQKRAMLRNAIDRYKSVDDGINDIKKRFENHKKQFNARAIKLYPT